MAILADPTLQLQDLSGSVPSSTIAISSGYFWGLSFSNTANTAIFGDDSPVVIDHDFPQLLRYKEEFLGMIKPTGGPLTASIPFADVATKFGISSTTSPALDTVR
jgi:hypothetical protein